MTNSDTLFIDFHSHTLPRVDHGSHSLSESLEQLRIASAAGVDTIMATPHFYPNSDNVDSFLRRVDDAVEQLKGASLPPIQIGLGAEVLFCNQLEKMEGLERLCIRGTNVLLLEAPMDAWNTAFWETTEALTKRFTVVLAHIDRYVRNEAEMIHQLLDLGALAQINGYAFHYFTMRRRLKPFMESDRVVALGSDLHGADAKAYARFAESQKRLGPAFDTIMRRTSDLLKNAELINVSK